MAKIRIVGDSSGYVELSAPNAAGNNTLELPSSGTRLLGGDVNNNLNVGVITATNIFASSAVITGNVSVAGTVTYEDTTNVDSIGVITARSGIHVTGGSIGIGTNNPQARLQVNGSVVKTSLDGLPVIFSSNDATNPFQLVFQRSASTDTVPVWSITSVEQSVAYRGLSLQPNGGNTLIGMGGGNLGIATLSPSSPLEVRSGNTAIINAKVANGQYGDIRITSEEGNELTIGYARNSTNYGAQTTAGDFSIKTTAPRLHFPIGAGNANSAMTITASGTGIRNSSPDCTLSVGTGNIRMASGYSRMVSGYKGSNASSFTMFDIVGIFREDLTELIIKHGHEGGGMHGSYRRWIFTSNASNVIQTFEDTNNINYGGGNGFSFTFPTYGTLRITWGGASGFAQDFYLACWIRCRNNISFTNQGMDSFSS